MLEETGIQINAATYLSNYRAIAHQFIATNVEKIYHTGTIYLVSSYDESGLIQEMNK